MNAGIIGGIVGANISSYELGKHYTSSCEDFHTEYEIIKEWLSKCETLDEKIKELQKCSILKFRNQRLNNAIQHTLMNLLFERDKENDKTRNYSKSHSIFI